ncbi:MAG TPA: hypothetical protein VKT80_08040, partial [Chloroflexota bacterium]|nr:hypothetical protein [Chloroflexota bacterium]
TGKMRHLTNKGDWYQSLAFAMTAVAAPDGRSIAYGWFSDDLKWELRRIGADGSGVRTLNTSDWYVQPYCWTPDGKSVIALLQQSDAAGELSIIDASTGSKRVLQKLDWRAPAGASVSPDGRYLAYDIQAGTTLADTDIAIMDLDSGKESRLTQGSGANLYPAWTPDGTELLFTSDRTGPTSLWALPMAGKKASGEPHLVRSDIGRTYTLTMTHDGTLFYTTEIGNNNIYEADYDPAAGRIIGAPRSIVNRYVGWNSYPAWAPDGKSFCYISLRVHSPTAGPSLIVRTDDGQERDLQPKLWQIWSPRFSADGKTVYVRGIGRMHQSGIYAVDVATGTQRPLIVVNAWVNALDVSPDGHALYYALRDQNHTVELIRRDLMTGKETVVF